MDRKDEAFEAGMGVRRDMFGAAGVEVFTSAAEVLPAEKH
jgi:hypothetical protein